MEKEGVDSVVAEEVPLLHSGHPANVQVANPSQSFVQSVSKYPSSFVALQVEQTGINEQPFCSCYLVLFFLGIFVNPLFHLCGMCGLTSNRTHEYFAGKLSAIACLVIFIVLIVWVILVMAAGAYLEVSFGDEES